MLHQDIDSSTKAEERAKEKKTESKAKSEQSLMEAEADLKDASATLADDTKYLQDLNTTCQKKADEFSSRQQLRSEEIAALEKAIQIMESDDIAGAAAKHLPAASLFAQKAHSTAFVQVGHPPELSTDQL